MKTKEELIASITKKVSPNDVFGKVLTLEDILVAMEIDEDDGSDPELQDKVTALAYMWSKCEPLHEQTEETLLFIDGLLN